MKKRCNYCRVLIKCDNIKYHKDDGRGVYCDFCGGFISIPKQINGNVEISGSHHRKNKIKLKNRIRSLEMITRIIFLFGLICLYYNINKNEFQIVNEKQNSTFILYDYNTGVDISDEIDISILVLKENIIIDDIDDIYNISNYISNDYVYKAFEIQIDIRDLEYICILIDPYNTSFYISEYYIIIGGVNRQFYFELNLIKTHIFAVLKGGK